MFGERLEQALAHASKTRPWLATTIGVTESAITMVLNGQAKSMSAKNCAKAAKALGVSCLWLATGEGEMVESDQRLWREVARGLAATMDAAERSQRFAQFVLKVDEIIEQATLQSEADRASVKSH